jgi:VWFA-related protein
MRRSFPACAALVFFLTNLALALQSACLAAPEKAPEAMPPITRDQAGGMIHMDVVVTDPSGTPVSGLRPEDFSLLDNGNPEKIQSFRSVSGASADPKTASRLILVIDTIDLNLPDLDRKPELASEEFLAVEQYLRRNGGHLTRPVSIYLIDDSGLWTVAHPEGDGNVLADDVVHNHLKSIRKFWSTQIRATDDLAVPDSAAMSTLKSLGQIAADERRKPGRKLLVWVGPGESTGRGLFNDLKAKKQQAFVLNSMLWFSTLLREARIALYTLTLGEPGPPDGKDENYLVGPGSPERAFSTSWDRKVLAVRSGGRVLAGYIVSEQIERCVREADTYYTLTFDPAHAHALNEYHELKVLVNRPGLTARTNSGYYDQPWYAVERFPAARTVTVKQLERMLAENRSDGEIARRIEEMELSERLNETRFAALIKAVPGKHAREALRILADASAFLDPPPEEAPATAPPDAEAQRRILDLAAEYLTASAHKMPDYLARRTAVRFQETPQLKWGSVQSENQPLHHTSTLIETTYYRHGIEVAEPEKPGGRRKNKDDSQLVTYGTFGPILDGVRDAISRHSDLTWSRWEQGVAGPAAVFRYAVPADLMHFQVKVCCLPDGDGKDAYFHHVGYHGEVAIDPETGSILRLEWSADLKSTTPVARSGIMIEYGQVEIGGMKYICPVRSISMMRTRSVVEASEWDVSFLTFGPYTTSLNEIQFSNYRQFRSSVKLLPEFIPVPDEK